MNEFNQGNAVEVICGGAKGRTGVVIGSTYDPQRNLRFIDVMLEGCGTSLKFRSKDLRNK